MKLTSHTTLIIRYRNRITKCPDCYKIFRGKTCNVLAANFQSAHPELEEMSSEWRHA